MTFAVYSYPRYNESRKTGRSPRYVHSPGSDPSGKLEKEIAAPFIWNEFRAGSNF